MTTNPAPANYLLTEVRELLAQPGPVQDQAEAVDRLRDLEAVKGMLEAEQALVTASFEKLRLEHEASQKVPKAQRGKGLAAEIALARSESPARGKHHLELPKPYARTCLTPWQRCHRDESARNTHKSW